LLELNHEKKTTILVTTHLMEEAEKCSELVILDRGKIIARGAPAVLKAELPGGVIEVETTQTEALSEELKRLFQINPVKTQRGIKFEHSEPQRVMSELVMRFSQDLDSVIFHKPGLEDVFLKKTGRTFDLEGEDRNGKK